MWIDSWKIPLKKISTSKLEVVFDRIVKHIENILKFDEKNKKTYILNDGKERLSLIFRQHFDYINYLYEKRF